MAEERFVILGPNEGVRREARGSVMRFKALAATTGGRFSLMERTLPPDGRLPPAHIHEERDEAYVVLEGRVTFLLAGTEQLAGPETFVLVPRGTAHTFGNGSDRPARLLVLHVPALDGYFAELEALWQGSFPPTQEEEQALMRRHGMRSA